MKISIETETARIAYGHAKGKQYTQNEFCEEFGVSPPTIISYAAGRTPDVLRFLVEVMEATGLKFEDLITIKNNNNENK